MNFMIYAALSLTFVLVLCVLSFWIGRCGRRIPIIDEGLPWTLRLDEAPPCAEDCTEAHLNTEAHLKSAPDHLRPAPNRLS